MKKISEKRKLLPIVMDQKQSEQELYSVEGHCNELCKKIVDLILDEKLTPLQAQAALVRVWVTLQCTGRITHRGC